MLSRREKGLLYVIGGKMAGLGEGGESGEQSRRKEGARETEGEKNGRNHIHLSTNKSNCCLLPLP